MNSTLLSTLFPAEHVLFRMILKSTAPLSIADLNHLATDYGYSFSLPTVDTTVRGEQYRSLIGTYQYELFPELCLSCMARTGNVSTVRVALACPQCYTPEIYLRPLGYDRIYTIANALEISLYGLGFDLVSQIIYQLLSIHPEKYSVSNNN